MYFGHCGLVWSYGIYLIPHPLVKGVQPNNPNPRSCFPQSPLPSETPSSVVASLGIAAVPAPLPEPMCTAEMAAKIDDRAENITARFMSDRKRWKAYLPPLPLLSFVVLGESTLCMSNAAASSPMVAVLGRRRCWSPSLGFQLSPATRNG